MKLSKQYLLIAFASAAAFAAMPTQAASAAPASNSLLYSHAEMFSFDTESYLLAQAPELAQYAEIISHWARLQQRQPARAAGLDRATQRLDQPLGPARRDQPPHGQLVQAERFQRPGA